MKRFSLAGGLSPVVKVHLALMTVSLIYGFFYVAVKLLLQEITEFELFSARLILAAVLVGAAERLFFKTRFQSALDLLKVCALGLLGVLLVQLFVILGIHRTTTFHASLIMSTIPVMTVLFSLILRREAFQWRKLIGILIAFSGVAMLLMIGNPHDPLPETYLAGDIFILLNAMGFSWFLIASQPLVKRYSSFSMMAYAYMASGLMILLALAFQAGTQPVGNLFRVFDALSFGGWTLLLYVVLFASIGTYTLNNYALTRSTPSTVAVYIFTQPIIASLAGYYILGEHMTLAMAMAGLITFAGVMLATGSMASRNRRLDD